jgi:hypothetical protein
MTKRWIQKAIKRKDALRDWFMREYGSDAFTERGTIKEEYMRRALRRHDVSEKTKRRIRLALTLRKLRKRR